MNYLELEQDNLAELLQQNQRVMVQYGAAWCGNCKIAKPKFKRIAFENESVLFVYVDAEVFPVSRLLANVSNLPTFAAFENGSLVKQAQGNKEETIKEVCDAITHH